MYITILTLRELRNVLQSKKNCKSEKYLHAFQNNNLRRQITGIRCGSNLMPINYLRKLNIKRQERICTLCSNGSYLGTEMHLVMECVTMQLLSNID